MQTNPAPGPSLEKNPTKPVSPPTAAAAATPENQQDQNKSKKPWFIFCFIILIGLIILLGAALVVVTLNNQNNVNVSQTPPVSTSEPSVAPTDTLVTNRVFYEREKNIYSYNVQTKEYLKWTDYQDKGDVVNNVIYDITIIDNQTVGYGRCVIVTGDYGCGLYALDLKTKKITEKKKLGKDISLMSLDFATPDKFAYLVSVNPSDPDLQKWQLILSDNDTLKTLEDIKYEVFGRGGFIEDSQKMRFSQDGKHLLQISTSSPRDSLDFNVYVYDLNKGTRAVISGATHPDWLDNTTIIYRKYENSKGDGLYLYDVVAKTQEKINDVVNSAVTPIVLKNKKKVLYTVFTDLQIWVYDMDTKKNTKLLDDALGGVWASESQIVYNETAECTDQDFFCEEGYKIESTNIYDLETGSKPDELIGAGYSNVATEASD
ncbi:MAG TPA: hypothetical protein VJC17_01100 [Candidatus Dojkabacteria bacterium]|nr:hypothetical protein [Candidatus Dojkabacteria bacterium]